MAAPSRNGAVLLAPVRRRSLGRILVPRSDRRFVPYRRQQTKENGPSNGTRMGALLQAYRRQLSSFRQQQPSGPFSVFFFSFSFFWRSLDSAQASDFYLA